MDLSARLNGLAARILLPDVLEGRGLGNEIGFFVFEYEPSSELEVRTFLPSLCRQIAERQPSLRVAHVSLLSVIKDLLDSESLWDRAVSLEASQSTSKALVAIQRFVTAERVADRLATEHPPSATDLYLISGVGAAYPLTRAHAVLSNLHSRVEGRPLVMLFPGSFSGTRLSLFDRLQDDHYYRAFRLNP
jgi:hypothetical protein